MVRWAVQLLLVLAVAAQGGRLRACELQLMVVGGADGGACSAVGGTVANAPSDGLGHCYDAGAGPSDDCDPCPCEFRKGLARPGRVGADVHVPSFDCLTRAPGLLAPSGPLSTIVRRSQLPAVTLVSHCPPLLI